MLRERDGKIGGGGGEGDEAKRTFFPPSNLI